MKKTIKAIILVMFFFLFYNNVLAITNKICEYELERDSAPSYINVTLIIDDNSNVKVQSNLPRLSLGSQNNSNFNLKPDYISKGAMEAYLKDTLVVCPTNILLIEEDNIPKYVAVGTEPFLESFKTGENIQTTNFLLKNEFEGGITDSAYLKNIENEVEAIKNRAATIQTKIDNGDLSEESPEYKQFNLKSKYIYKTADEIIGDLPKSNDRSDDQKEFAKYWGNNKSTINKINDGKLSINELRNSSNGIFNIKEILGSKSNEEDLLYWLQFAFNIIKYSGVIIIILMTMVDYGKVILSNKPDEGMKEASSKLVKRAIILVSLILLPLLLNFILKIFGFFSGMHGIN